MGAYEPGGSPASGSVCTRSDSSNDCNDSGSSCIRAAAATPLSLPAAAAGVVAADKWVWMSVNNGKSRCGRAKTSARTNEWRKRRAHTMPDNGGIGSTGWMKWQWQQLHPHHPLQPLPRSPTPFIILLFIIYLLSKYEQVRAAAAISWYLLPTIHYTQ